MRSKQRFNFHVYPRRKVLQKLLDQIQLFLPISQQQLERRFFQRAGQAYEGVPERQRSPYPRHLALILLFKLI